MLTSDRVKSLAHECGFELAGVAPVDAITDYARYQRWIAHGHAGEMCYLTDHRAGMRRDVRALLPSARSVVCVGKLYNTPDPPPDPGAARVSRYAWGAADYHDVLRAGLQQLADRLTAHAAFDYKICVDTAPLLERSLARDAGLGWIGRNTCLINEPRGSWFFLGELITSLELASDTPPEDRCGTCTACIDACPTQALIPSPQGTTLDSRRCISYLTIELRGPIPAELHASMGEHVFGCDICQNVCPWNRRAPVTQEPGFAPRPIALHVLESLPEEEFRKRFRRTPVARAKHAGILRNAAIARANRDG